MRAKSKTLTTIISVAVDESTKKSLDDTTFKTGLGLSQILRYGIRLALEAIEQGRYLEDRKRFMTEDASKNDIL